MSTTTTPTSHHSSTGTSLRRTLGERRELRSMLIGMVLLIIAVPQMFLGRTPASSGHYILAGIGLLLLVVGAVTRITSNRR